MCVRITDMIIIRSHEKKKNLQPLYTPVTLHNRWPNRSGSNFGTSEFRALVVSPSSITGRQCPDTTTHGTADCRPRQTPSQPPLAVSRQYCGSPMGCRVLGHVPFKQWSSSGLPGHIPTSVHVPTSGQTALHLMMCWDLLGH